MEKLVEDALNHLKKEKQKKVKEGKFSVLAKQQHDLAVASLLDNFKKSQTSRFQDETKLFDGAFY